MLPLCLCRTDNAVKNRWAALVRKNPALGEEGEGGSGGGSYEGAFVRRVVRVRLCGEWCVCVRVSVWVGGVVGLMCIAACRAAP